MGKCRPRNVAKAATRYTSSGWHSSSPAGRTATVGLHSLSAGGRLPAALHTTHQQQIRRLAQWRVDSVCSNKVAASVAGMLGSLHTQSVECRIVLIITQCWWSFPQLSHNRRWRFRHKRVFTFKCSGHNRRCTQYFGRSDNNISQPTACGSKTTA